MKERKAMLVLVIIIAAALSAFAQEARVAVINPERPSMFSRGEIVVLLDAIEKQINKSRQFQCVELVVVEKVLEKMKLNRVDACPDKTCLRGIAGELSLDYVVTLSIELKERAFDVRLEMYEIPSGKIAGGISGQFKGAKSQLALKFVPKQTKELVRTTEWKAANKPKRPAKTITAAKPDATKQQTAAKPSGAAPATAEGADGKKKASVLKSPAFWIPAVLVVAVPIVLVYYVRASQEPGDENGEVQTGGEMDYPPTPQRPSAFQLP
jgi:hypothetical protein